MFTNIICCGPAFVGKNDIFCISWTTFSDNYFSADKINGIGKITWLAAVNQI